MPEKQNDRLEDLLLNDSFVRFIKDIAAEEEKLFWQEWQYQHPDHQVLIREAKELIEFTEYNKGRIPDPHIELKKFEKSLEGSSFFPKKPGEMKMRRIRKKSGSYWLTTAAVIVLSVLSVGVFQFMEKDSGSDPPEELAAVSKSDYRTGFGEKAFLNLSDGSRIVLNANSHLSYSWSGSGNSGQNIDIHLEGEAWFDIEPHTGQDTRLLRVHTHDGIVEVTGTVFAVQTSSQGTRAVLEKGEVSVTRLPLQQLSGQTGSHSKILHPGEMAQLLPGNDEIVLEKVNPKLYTSWIRDVWTFDQTPLNQIAERIETVFGVKVNISSANLRNQTLSGTISSANLQLIKEGLSEALQVQVSQVNDTIIIGPV